VRGTEGRTEGSSPWHWMGRHWRRCSGPLVQVWIIRLVHNFRTTHYIHIHIAKRSRRNTILLHHSPSLFVKGEQSTRGRNKIAETVGKGHCDHSSHHITVADYHILPLVMVVSLRAHTAICDSFVGENTLRHGWKHDIHLIQNRYWD
jgi:hypothetical protein